MLDEKLAANLEAGTQERANQATALEDATASISAESKKSESDISLQTAGMLDDINGVLNEHVAELEAKLQKV
jgi:hypothetical protein